MIEIKKHNGGRRTISKKHPWKQHQPQMFTKRSTPVDEYFYEAITDRLIKKMKKSGKGSYLRECK